MYFIVLYSLLFFTTNIIYLLFELDGYYRFYYGFVTLFEFIFFAAFIRTGIRNTTCKKVLTFSTIAFIFFLLIYTPNAKFVRIDSIPIGVETILILLFSFYYLFEQVNSETIEPLFNNYRFWILLGMLIYLAGSFFIYIFTSQLPYEQVMVYWRFIDVFLIIKNLFFLTGILVFCLQQSKKKAPQQSRTFKTIS